MNENEMGNSGIRARRFPGAGMIPRKGGAKIGIAALGVAAVIGGYVLVNSLPVSADNPEYTIKDRQLENGCLQSFYETNFGNTNHLDIVCPDGSAYKITDNENNFTADYVTITRVDGENAVTETFRAPKASADPENPTVADPNLVKIIDDSTRYLNQACSEIFDLKTSTMYKIMGQ